MMENLLKACKLHVDSDRRPTGRPAQMETKALANATLNEREKERQRADATDYEKIHIASSCLVFFNPIKEPLPHYFYTHFAFFLTL